MRRQIPSTHTITCPACRTVFPAAVPAGKRLRCGRCRHRFALLPPLPVPAGTPARSGPRPGWVAAAVVAGVLLGGTFLFATRSRSPQANPAPRPAVARQTGKAPVPQRKEPASDARPKTAPPSRQAKQDQPKAARPPQRGKPAPRDARQLAKQRLDQAAAEFQKWRKWYDAEDERVAWARHRRIAAPPINRTVAMNYNAAWVALQQARQACEATQTE